MINLQVKRPVKLTIDKSILIRAAQLTLDEQHTTPGSELSVVIGDDAMLKELNLKYRAIDTATDVLSFPTNEPDPETNSLYLGDVVVSLPRAEEQASAGGHALADELQLLVVHGTLHLLGFDHLHRADKARMQAAQDQILSMLGVNLVNTL